MILEALTEKREPCCAGHGPPGFAGLLLLCQWHPQECIDVLSQRFDTILIDGEAGIEQINRQVMRRVNDLLILSDSSHCGRIAVLIR